VKFKPYKNCRKAKEMILLERWLQETVGLDPEKYLTLVEQFHEHNIYSIEDLYSSPKDVIKTVISDSDIIMEEWEAFAFFGALEKLDSKIVVCFCRGAFLFFVC
jgi:hypothetical protein